MKRIIIITCLLLTLLGLLSCDRRESQGLPSLLEAYIEPKHDFYLSVEYVKYLDSDSNDMWVNIVCKNKLLALKLNETEIPIDRYNYLESSGAYMYDFDLWDITHSYIGNYDEMLAYQIVFENKTVSGSLLIPSEYFCEPTELDPNQDYEVAWSLATNPRAQDGELDIYFYSDGYMTYTDEISPSRRNYTFPKSLWDQIGQIRGEELTLIASNYEYTQGGLVWIISSGEYFNYDWTKTKPKNRILDLLNNRISLPE